MNTINNELNAAAKTMSDAAEAVLATTVTKKRFNLKTISIYAGIGLLAVGAAAGAVMLLARKGDAIVEAVEVVADVVGDAGSAVVDTVVEAI